MTTDAAPPHIDDLFGAPPPAAEPARPRRPSARQGVQPAAATPELQALAQRLPHGLRIGTSSWSYPGWEGLVYGGGYSEPQLARKGLAAYGQHPLLRTVSIDRGFYAPIPLADYVAYAASVPDDFRFAVKAPAAVCDAWIRESDGRGRQPNPAFLNAEFAVRDFVEPATRGLDTRCGPLVFQLSPLGALAEDAIGFLERLEAFLAALPPLDRQRTPDAVYAVELRDATLLTPRFIKMLRAVGVRYCVGLHERMPAADRQAAAVALLDAGAPGPLVVRWNLNSRYRYAQAEAAYKPFDKLVDEDPFSRETLADMAVAALAACRQVTILVSNKAEGCSPLSCIRLAEAIAARLPADTP
ncbi:DUF72 domain-containing protein [Ralstonia nicotianae]|nr:hypothetical protein BLA34_12870 [Ralstonia solanacearum]QIK19371.1 DUF72 domain-containing protein [Ralstonia solanacearum]QVX37651.1 DUF72 domain-containing protein [Ralstonia solanacearum]